jgi:hypothetical protein
MKNLQDQASGGSIKQQSTPDPHPSTPQASFRQFVASPGGFQLLDFVNSVGSPFLHLPPDGPKHTTKSTPGSVGSTPRRDVEWHQTSITHDSFRLIDWTLKSKLQFQCQPGLSSVHCCDARVQREAMRLFLSPDVSRDEAAIDPAAQFLESLYYWQHPAVVQSDRQQNMPRTTLSMGRNANSTLPTEQSSLVDVKSMPPPIAKVSKSNEEHRLVWVDERKQMWQQAFCSLLSSWTQRIRHIAERWVDKDSERCDPKDMADTYFYAVGKGHVALFRMGLSERNVDGEASHLLPEIVVSSSTLALRNKLRAMGARWYLLARYEDFNGEFHEEMLETERCDPYEKCEENIEYRPTVSKDDILALRRAQALGKTAGADVSFSMRPRNGRVRPRLPSRVPPLCLHGIDDCLAFAEAYLNAFGQISTGQPLTWGNQNLDDDVPLLLCRKLGPFLHSTLNKVTCVRSDYGPQNSGASFKVLGTLLPCAVRSLVSASIQCMLDERKKEMLTDFHDDSTGGHVIVQLSQQTTKTAVLSSEAIGDGSTKFFNSRSPLWDVVQCDKGHFFQCCRYQEMLQTAIWDADRPTDLVYKLDHTTSFLSIM